MDAIEALLIVAGVFVLLCGGMIALLHWGASVGSEREKRNP